MVASERKKELDRQRNEWRNKHRTLGGRVILYPEKPPEHVNARASRLYNRFWKVLLQVEPQDIPGIISGLRRRMDGKSGDTDLRTLRTMIGMAEDAYQLSRLEEIQDNDSELQMGEGSVATADNGVMFRAGKIFTAEYSEEEDEILVRDIEGLIVDALSSDDQEPNGTSKNARREVYKNWEYTTSDQ